MRPSLRPNRFQLSRASRQLNRSAAFPEEKWWGTGRTRFATEVDTKVCSIAYYLRYDLFCRQYLAKRVKPVSDHAVNLDPPRGRRGKRKTPSKSLGRVGPQSAAQSAPHSHSCVERAEASVLVDGQLAALCSAACDGGLQMNVCWINEARRLVERSHECPRRSDQTISMHTWRSYRVWMGLSPSIELNNANGKTVHMPSTYCTKPYRIATSPAFRRKLSSQQASVLKSAPKRALYLRGSSRFAA